MAYKIIQEDCIACDACYEACLFHAVTRAHPSYIIDWDKCNECSEIYDRAQCALACPLDKGCIPDPYHIN